MWALYLHRTKLRGLLMHRPLLLGTLLALSGCASMDLPSLSQLTPFATSAPKVETADIGVTECDRLTASSLNPYANSPDVPIDDLDAEPAIAACEADLKAHPGHPRLQVQLARALVKDNQFDRAFTLRQQSAQAGYPYGIYALAYSQYKGEGSTIDYSAALANFQKAANSGAPVAWNLIGHFYNQGLGVERDIDKAISALRKAAEDEFKTKRGTNSMTYVASLLRERDGWGDKREARRWYGRAAEQGSGLGMNGMGLLALDEDRHNEALQWFLRAADAGFITGHYNVGQAYRYGWGVQRDLGQAAQWYRQAAEKGHIEASLQLGRMYATGSGVAQNPTEAMRWFTMHAPTVTISE